MQWSACLPIKLLVWGLNPAQSPCTSPRCSSFLLTLGGRMWTWGNLGKGKLWESSCLKVMDFYPTHAQGIETEMSAEAKCSYGVWPECYLWNLLSISNLFFYVPLSCRVTYTCRFPSSLSSFFYHFSLAFVYIFSYLLFLRGVEGVSEGV